MKYVIKSVPSDSTKELEDLLNEMSTAGWDLYSMHEVEADEGYQYNCIFAREDESQSESDTSDVVNITTFRSQMEKMLSSSPSPYESCKELQEKIKEQRKKIAKIKSQLEAQSEAPVSKNRKDLNEEISKGLKELDELRQRLIKAISPEAMFSQINQEKLSICLSEENLDLVSPDAGGVLIAETVKIRQKLANELGYVIPKIVFEDDEKLSANEFSIKVRGLEVVTSYAYPGHLMFYAEDLKLDKKTKELIAATDAVSGRKTVWLDEKKAKGFWQKGINAQEYISTVLEYISIKYVDDLLDYADINKYVDIVGDKNMFLIENLVPDFVSIAELRYILVCLLRERVSIKDIVYIFEKINDYVDEASKEDLLDKIRLALSRFISKSVSSPDGVITGLDLSEKTCKELFDNLENDDNIVRIDGKKVAKFTKSLVKKIKENQLDVSNLIIFSPLEVRHIFFMVISQFLPNVQIIAKEEITNDYTIEIIDEI